MKVSQCLNQHHCILELLARDKEGIIRELTQRLFETGALIDQEKFIGDVLSREALGSTAIGNNIALPHARTEAVTSIAIAFGRSIDGIDCKSLDGEKVNLFFLMGACPGELNKYLRLLAELSKLLMNSLFRRELLMAQNPGDVIRAIEKFER